jgi:4-amino-4-deoxychorismate lyase
MVSSVRRITRVHTLDGDRLPEVPALHSELNALYESDY